MMPKEGRPKDAAPNPPPATGGEQARGAREEQFRLIVENALEYAIFTMDLHGRVTSWNRGAERLLGYDEDEVLGQAAHIIFRPEDRERGAPERELGKALAEGRAEDNRWHLRKDGSRFWANGMVMPLYDEAEELYGLLKIIRDQTAQHQQDEERERWAAELEQRVKQQAAEAERRIKQLRRLTVQLNRAEQRERRQLAKVLHDDLQQMLVAARMGVQTLEPGAKFVEGRRRVDAILEQAVGASRSLSYELSPPVLQTDGLAAALHWLAEHFHERHGLPLAVEADEALSNSLSEDVQNFLFHAGRELLFNVVKHSGATQAWVRLEADADDSVRLVVEDDGVGCDAEFMLNGEGDQGFGLFSMRERLEIWEGRLDASVRPEGGCQIALQLPRSPND